MPRQKKIVLPTPAKFDSRICFSLVYFTSEADAEVYAAHVRAKGFTYNGGWFDGMSCGRETRFDHVSEMLGPLYAVSE